MSINLDETTFIKLLKNNAERFGDRKAALRAKKRGIWQPTSWQRYYEQTKYFSLGLYGLGLKAGETVAIIGNNRPASLYAVIAVQAAGGIPLCLYQDAPPAEVAALLERFGACLVIAEDQEQVDKILEIKERLPGLSGIVFCEPRGMRSYRETLLHSFEELTGQGAAYDKSHPGEFEKRISDGRGDDTAIICCTSGTTGHPKGAMLSFRGLLGMAASLDQVEKKFESDEFVSFLPLAWFGEQLIALASALVSGFTVNFPENPDTTMSDLREIGPHIIFWPPQVWEEVASSVRVRIMETTPFKRFMYRTFMPFGQQVAEMKLSGRAVSLPAKILYGIAHVCLFRALRDRLGLSRVRSALTGGSALGPDVFKFFHAIGVNLKQVYGLTEISGISCIHRDGDVRGTTVGPPLPGTEVRVDDNGEILLRSPGVFQGYCNDRQASAAILKDAWLHTGDTGYLDQHGHLVVTDRLQDVFRLPDGSQLAPQQMESQLKFSPYIKEAVVIGKERPYLSALICIDGRVAGKWAGDNKLTYTTYSDLASKPEVVDLVERELLESNRDFPPAARIKRFAVLYKDLDADESELTRTGKLRRIEVENRYRDVIEALYSNASSMPVDVEIELRDGRSARICSTVHFRTIIPIPDQR